jgi:type I restriction enzyme, S subunit
MFKGLSGYPGVLDSGVAWLGEVPEHWRLRRIKALFRELDERSGDGQGVLLSLTRARGILPHSEASKRMASAPDLSKYKVCRPGDLVMNRMQAWSGMFAMSTLHGLVSPDYSVFSPRDSCEVKYFELLFKTPLLVDEFAKRSRGIGSGFNRLYSEDFGAVKVPFPSLAEQRAIVRFLGHAEGCIRRHIHAKQRLLALLEEQKQRIVHRAVLRGLDSDASLGPTAGEWMGAIPAHWDVRRAKYLFREVDRRSLTGTEGLLSLRFGYAYRIIGVGRL